MEMGWTCSRMKIISPQNNVWETSAEIPYWWSGKWFWLVEANFQPIRSTTQVWVVMVISIEFLHSFLRCRFVGKPVVGLWNVSCFLKLLVTSFFLHSGGPTVPIKSRLPPSGTRTPPRVARTENKSDDKLFEFLNSNIPATKERKVIKPKVSVESSSEVVSKPISNMEETQVESIDGKLNEGELIHLLLWCPQNFYFIPHLEL